MYFGSSNGQGFEGPTVPCEGRVRSDPVSVEGPRILNEPQSFVLLFIDIVVFQSL